MNQIYNLLEAIELDKKMITELEDKYLKKINTLKGVLAAHEEALERLTTVPKLTIPADMETFAKGFNTLEESRTKRKNRSQNRQRITMENWKDLNIEVGGTVEIVVSGDGDFSEGSYKVTNVEESCYCGGMFLEIKGESKAIPLWYCYNVDEKGLDEIYLIKG